MGTVTKYRRTVGRGYDQFDIDDCVVHADRYGATLCGRVHDAPQNGMASRRGWELSSVREEEVTCKHCRRKLGM